MNYTKYHALGNDYIIIDPANAKDSLSKAQIKAICQRNFGIGADGILLGPIPPVDAGFSLRIFNPDGSEAEKSGNGLRIFSRYLWDKNLVNSDPFEIKTAGGTVLAQIFDNGKIVNVEMGTVNFGSAIIPITGAHRDVLNETITALDKDFSFCAATIGNPHCVILSQDPSKDEACKYGPVIETNPIFPNRTNVQFMEIIDRNNIRIEIWERGAGYTLASGSSASASAAVALKLNMCDSSISVHMPGGILEIVLSDNFAVSMKGPVTKVCEGVIHKEILR
ncbi:MAG: diaminopimelate epimerase, partial [Kiritimatiellae bacterium]|nr:diaminopimelate epimerase [Kiritimatiellia bacterium]